MGCHSYEMFRTGQSTETESRLVAAQGLGRGMGGTEAMAKWYGVSFRGDENVL